MTYLAKNSGIVHRVIERCFQPSRTIYIHEIENQLIKIVELCFRNVGLRLREPVVSFGSTARNTNVKDHIEFDLSVYLEEISEKRLLTEVTISDSLKREIMQNLAKKGFEAGEFLTMGVIRDKPWYRIYITNITPKNVRYLTMQVDLIINLFSKVNIGLINHKVISPQLGKIEEDLGTLGKNELLAQICFTKWFFKQERDQVNFYGAKVFPVAKEAILAKRGFRSIHIEYILIQLSQKDESGTFTRVGSFNVLMNLIYNIDVIFRRSLPTSEKERIIPLEHAKITPSLAKIKRTETICQLEDARSIGTLPEHLENIHENIFSDFEDDSKWFLLVKMVRDYFRDDEFSTKYLLPCL